MDWVGFALLIVVAVLVFEFWLRDRRTRNRTYCPTCQEHLLLCECPDSEWFETPEASRSRQRGNSP